MKVAYIAGPYRSNTVFGTLQNIRAAEAVALKYWGKGYAVICPHKNTALFDGALGDDADQKVWLEGDLELLKRSDVIIMMSNWRPSKGAAIEHDLAQSLGLDIIYD